MGLCGEFTLDGRSSSGGAGRSLSAIWEVSADNTDDTAVAAARVAVAPYNGSLQANVNVTALEVGSMYTFTLLAESFLGAGDMADVSVSRRCVR